MAKLNGFFIGTTAPGGICLYQMNGKAYMRSKSSLTRKKVLKSKAFAKTRQYAGNMAIASRLGSFVYQQLQAVQRNRSLYQAITGEAASMLYEGMGEEEVREWLLGKYVYK